MPNTHSPAGASGAEAAAVSEAASRPNTDPDALLTEVQAADFLNLSVRTLQAWRLRGGGSRYIKCGRAVRYRRRDLIAYLDTNTVAHTSDLGQAA